MALNFLECLRDFRVVFELSLFEDWNDAYLAVDASCAVFKLREDKLDLGHEEESTFSTDLIVRFRRKNVLVVNQFASNYSKLFALIFYLDLATIDRHLRCARR